MATDDIHREPAETESREVEVGASKVAGVALGPTEEVLHDTRPSYWNWPLWTATIIGLFYPWWRRRRIRYIVTTDRVIIKRGRMSKETTEVHHEDITQIRNTKGTVERLTRKGTIELDTAHDECIELKAVPRHSKVANAIRERRTMA